MNAKPVLSIVVVVYNMQREAARTLQSLAVPYQRDVSPESYEVIVVENRSDEPLDRAFVEGFGPGFRYFYRDVGSTSPACAANFGAAQARGSYLGLLVDGARIASPGLIRYALGGLSLAARPIVAALAWHLGPEFQWLSMTRGYDRQVEDALLEQSDWVSNGYNLFSISTLAGSSADGYFCVPAESNALFLSSELFARLGGFDESFTSPGGGYVNGDLFIRACASPGTELVVLLGEGTFHQVHGGASTNVTGDLRESRSKLFLDEYLAVRGEPFAAPEKASVYLGTLPPQAGGVLLHSVTRTGYAGKRLSSAAQSVPILFCIDAENNDFDPARGEPKPWTHLEACFDQLGAYRHRLEQATGKSVALTWAVRADPQVAAIYGDLDWGLRTYASKWRELAAVGDDIGLHPHPQRWSEVVQGWYGGQDDPVWIAKVIRDSFEAYCKVLGRAPQTFRFGNRFMSQDIASVVESLGMRFDLTLEPGYPGRRGDLAWHRVPGRCPDYFDVPRMPYRAVAANFREPDATRKTGICYIPMSTAPMGSAAPLARGPHFRAIAPSLFAYEVLHLRLSPELFRRAVDHLLRESPRPYLSVVIRCDMVHLPEVWANLETLRTHPLAGRFVFANADQLLGALGVHVA